MIKIIRGTYGCKKDSGGVRFITSADGPIALDPESEKRLVNRGVAEYVTDAPIHDADTSVSENEPVKKTVKKAGKKKTATTEETDEKAPELLAAEPV